MSCKIFDSWRIVFLASFRKWTQLAGRKVHYVLKTRPPWATVSAVLFCSASTISRWRRRLKLRRRRLTLTFTGNTFVPGARPRLSQAHYLTNPEVLHARFAFRPPRDWRGRHCGGLPG